MFTQPVSLDKLTQILKQEGYEYHSINESYQKTDEDGSVRYISFHYDEEDKYLTDPLVKVLTEDDTGETVEEIEFYLWQLCLNRGILHITMEMVL